MAKKNDLNKGLKALLGDIERKNTAEKQEVIRELSHSTAMIPVEDIEINPFQPRNQFPQEEMEELANSIRSLGLIQPITVRSLGGDSYQIISGERRWRAAKMAGMTEIPAYIRIADDQAMMEMALVENIQRTDLNALEIAFAYKRLLEEFEMTHESVAEKVGKNRSTVTNYLRLLKLPPTIQQGIRDEKISMGHARVLAGLEDLSLQLRLYQHTVLENLSVRALEKRAEKWAMSGSDKKPGISVASGTVDNPLIRDIENRLRSHFETPVKITRNQKGTGHIQIPFDSDEDLNAILDKIEM